MSSVSHLSLSQESYLISFHTSKDTSQGRGKRQKKTKNFPGRFVSRAKELEIH